MRVGYLAASFIAFAAWSGTMAASSAVDLKAALADPARPDADRARDADRKPAELIAFSGVRAGHTIAELAPGGGYFTRLLSVAVGPKGRVYALAGRPSPAVQQIATTHRNVSLVQSQPGQIPVPQVDMVWTTLNYHDFKNAKVGEGDGAAALNSAAFQAVKPGGIYFIVDHETAAGAGASQTSSLHRVESALVRREVEAAGFKLEAQSNLLRHPADDHSLRVQETGIRGKTDQFVLRFRKPKR